MNGSRKAESAQRRWTPQVLLAAGFLIAIAACSPLLLSLMQEQGMEAYADRRFESSRKWILVPAALGKAESQAVLGSMYALGQGVEKDAGSAIYWLEKAARADEMEAQTMLGVIYAMGIIAPQDPEKAVFWLSKATAHGDKEAERLLHLYRRPSI